MRIISPLVYMAESAVIDAFKSVKKFGKAVRVEYDARLMARAAKALKRQEARLAKMSTVERAQYYEDQAVILKRASELRGAAQTRKQGAKRKA